MRKMSNKAPNSPMPSTSQAQSNGLPVEIIYGLPSRNCRGMGICQVKLLENANNLCQCKSSSLALAKVSAKGGLELWILRHSLDPLQYQARFQNLELVLEETKVLESSVCEALKIGPAALLAGKYPVQESEEYIQVLIDLRTLQSSTIFE
jgi:hypothetical protein